MTCPACGHPLPLTWRRYAAASLGGLRCPECGVALSIGHRPAYWLLMPAAVTVVMVVCALPGIRLGAPAGTAVGVLGGMLVGLPLDRHLEQRISRLVVRR